MNEEYSTTEDLHQDLHQLVYYDKNATTNWLDSRSSRRSLHDCRYPLIYIFIPLNISPMKSYTPIFTIFCLVQWMFKFDLHVPLNTIQLVTTRPPPWDTTTSSRSSEDSRRTFNKNPTRWLCHPHMIHKRRAFGSQFCLLNKVFNTIQDWILQCTIRCATFTFWRGGPSRTGFCSAGVQARCERSGACVVCLRGKEETAWRRGSCLLGGKILVARSNALTVFSVKVAHLLRLLAASAGMSVRSE